MLNSIRAIFAGTILLFSGAQAAKADTPPAPITDVVEDTDVQTPDISDSSVEETAPVISPLPEVISSPLPPVYQPPAARGDFNKNFEFEQCTLDKTTPYIQDMTTVHKYTLNPRTVPRVQSEGLSRTEIRNAQTQLRTLGFDIAADGIQGRYTTLAVMQFQMLYGPVDNALTVDGVLNSATLDRLYYYAEQAERDAETYDVPAYAMAAIRLAEMRLGADFEFMTDLAHQESTFRKNVRARTSSAAGMYQFTIDTWLNNVYRQGCDYGFQDYADMITYELEELTPWQIRHDREARIRPTIKDNFERASILGMRNSHFLSTLMAVENSAYEIALVESFLGREITTNTEKYIVHFLGIEDSYFFFKAFDENPDAIAADLLVEPARSNQRVFYNRRGKNKTARTYQQVFDYFEEKFTTERYQQQYAFNTFGEYQQSLLAMNDVETPGNNPRDIASIDTPKIDPPTP